MELDYSTIDQAEQLHISTKISHRSSLINYEFFSYTSLFNNANFIREFSSILF